MFHTDQIAGSWEVKTAEVIWVVTPAPETRFVLLTTSVGEGQTVPLPSRRSVSAYRSHALCIYRNTQHGDLFIHK